MGAFNSSSFIRTAVLTGSVGTVLIAAPFIGEWEQLRNIAYLDPVRIPTICYGHTEGVKLGQTKTDEECAALLVGELKEYMDAVDSLVKVPMPDTRRAAFVSFTYNVGITNFKNSTLLRKLNAGDTIGACNELPRWVYAKGIKLKGLVRRREAERELCLAGTGEEI